MWRVTDDGSFDSIAINVSECIRVLWYERAISAYYDHERVISIRYIMFFSHILFWGWFSFETYGLYKDIFSLSYLPGGWRRRFEERGKYFLAVKSFPEFYECVLTYVRYGKKVRHNVLFSSFKWLFKMSLMGNSIFFSMWSHRNSKVIIF